jgi:hypothetical protein
VARQGVAYKLLTPDEGDRAGLIAMPQDQPYSPVFGAYLDVERTEALLWHDFVHRDLIQKSHWTDDATRGIPTYYAYAHIALAQAHQMRGNREEVDRNVRQAEAWMALSER